MSQAANATIYTGTFTGIVEDSRINAQDPVNAGNIDGERATGTFFFDTSSFAEYESSSPDSAYYWGAPVSLTFNAHGRDLQFDGSGYGALGVSSGTSQSLSASASDSPYWEASIYFGGSGLFTSNDLSTFNPSGVVASQSSANFFAGRDFGGTVLIDGLTFDGHSTVAPLPSSWTLLLPSLAWMGWIGSRRRSQQSS
jgi:hypothetical protein